MPKEMGSMCGITDDTLKRCVEEARVDVGSKGSLAVPKRMPRRRAYPIKLFLEVKVRESLMKTPPPTKPATIKLPLPQLVMVRERVLASTERNP